MGRLTDVLFARRDATPAPVRMIGFPSDGGLVTSGVTSTTVLGLSAVSRCLDILTNGVSQLDWLERRGTLDLPKSRIVTRPHPDMTRRDWTSFVVACLALHDRAYLLPTGGEDAEGVPMNLLPLDPTAVMPVTTSTVQFYSPLPADEYWVGTTRVPREKLIIINRGPLPGITETTMGLVKIARIKFAEALAADAYSSRYWQAGGPVDRALSTDANIPDQVATQLSDRWGERRSKGPDHWPVLTNGLKMIQSGVDPTQQSAVDARKELVADIGRYFGIGTELLNAPAGDSETYNTSELQGLGLVAYTIQNYVDAIQDAVSDLLPGSRRLFIPTDPLRRGTQLSRAQAYQLATGGQAWMLPEDVREAEGLPPVENPDELNPPAPTPVIAAGQPATGGNGNG